MGAFVGFLVGAFVGAFVGFLVGSAVGFLVGSCRGRESTYMKMGELQMHHENSIKNTYQLRTSVGLRVGAAVGLSVVDGGLVSPGTVGCGVGFIVGAFSLITKKRGSQHRTTKYYGM